MHMSINELCDAVRETSFAIHRYHRHGHLEIKKYVQDHPQPDTDRRQPISL